MKEILSISPWKSYSPNIKEGKKKFEYLRNRELLIQELKS